MISGVFFASIKFVAVDWKTLRLQQQLDFIFPDALAGWSHLICCVVTRTPGYLYQENLRNMRNLQTTRLRGFRVCAKECLLCICIRTPRKGSKFLYETSLFGFESRYETLLYRTLCILERVHMTGLDCRSKEIGLEGTKSGDRIPVAQGFWKFCWDRNDFFRIVFCLLWILHDTVDGSEIRNNHLGCIKCIKHWKRNWDKLPSSTG